MSELTDRRELFCQEYVKDLNATQAAIRAGYSKDTAQEQGSRLLSNVIISERISALQSNLATRNGITQDWIVQSLKSVAERCMQIEPVLNRKGEQVLCENRDGQMVPAFTFNALGANKSLELLGKTTGLFSDKLDVNITKRTINVTVDLYRDERRTPELAQEASDSLLIARN